MVMPFSLADALQHVGRLLHLGVVEAVEALVRQQQLRLGGERAGQLELLERGGAEPVGGRVRRRSAGRPGASASSAWRQQAARVGLAVLAEPGRQRDVLEQRQVAERARDLIGAADALVADAVGGQPADLLACELDRAGRRHVHAGDAVEGRALARAVRADQAEDLALLDVERDVARRR